LIDDAGPQIFLFARRQPLEYLQQFMLILGSACRFRAPSNHLGLLQMRRLLFSSAITKTFSSFY
jgi:hypothetical protein